MSSGKKYILLIGGQVAQCYEAIPIRKQVALTVANAFVNVRVSRFSYPANFRSDKGSNVMSNRFKNMCEELVRINRITTTDYHLQENAVIERTNHANEESLQKTWMNITATGAITLR